jgi:hypothetical protein
MNELGAYKATLLYLASRIFITPRVYFPKLGLDEYSGECFMNLLVCDVISYNCCGLTLGDAGITTMIDEKIKFKSILEGSEIYVKLYAPSHPYALIRMSATHHLTPARSQSLQ